MKQQMDQQMDMTTTILTKLNTEISERDKIISQIRSENDKITQQMGTLQAQSFEEIRTAQ